LHASFDITVDSRRVAKLFKAEGFNYQSAAPASESPRYEKITCSHCGLVL